MPLSVAVYQLANVGRSKTVCEAFARGILRAGDTVIRRQAETYLAPEADVAVFYGYTAELQKVMADYRAHGVAVYIDLGYFGRHDGGRRAGYHKISVNNRHPTAYFQKHFHLTDRIARWGNTYKPKGKRSGRNILLVGMSAKAARVENFEPEQWENDTIAALKKVTDRPIIYRPKPNWSGARPLPGAGYSTPGEPLEAALSDCHAVVTHHSNVAVDGLIAGAAAFCWDGVAKPMALQDLAQIERPLRSSMGDLHRWVADIAYTQWNVAEMALGLPWLHLKNEGMIR